MIGDTWVTEQLAPELGELFNVNADLLAELINERNIPKGIEIFVDLVYAGNLARINRDWNGWNLNPDDGLLESPNISYGRRLTVTRGKIMSFELRYQQIAALQQEGGSLRDRCEGQDKIIKELRALVKEQNDRIEHLETQLATANSHKIVHLRDRSA